MIEMKFISAFVLGLMSSGHCMGMCGGIASAFGLNVSTQKPFKLLPYLSAYNFGRICCYAFLGAVFASVGSLLLQQFSFLFTALRVFSGLMLMAMACYVGRWWLGLTALEKIGQKLWLKIQPLGLRVNPAASLTQAFLFGVLWGFLPCGLIYSMLVWVSAEAKPLDGALLMMCFGLGTFPALFSTAFAAGKLKNLLQHHYTRFVFASFLFGFGTWTVLSAGLH